MARTDIDAGNDLSKDTAKVLQQRQSSLWPKPPSDVVLFGSPREWMSGSSLGRIERESSRHLEGLLIHNGDSIVNRMAAGRDAMKVHKKATNRGFSSESRAIVYAIEANQLEENGKETKLDLKW